MNDACQFAAFVGIDWADREHAVCLATPDGREQPSTLSQTPAALDEWATQLRDRFGGQPIAVCLEQSRGALIYALMKYPWLVLFPINPKQSARYREVIAPSGAKDDPKDARTLCALLRLHHEQLRAWRPDDATTRSIRALAEARRKFVDLRTALGNRLRQELKECFPQALEIAGKHVYSQAFLKLLVKFPALKDLQRAAPRTLARLLPRRWKSAAVAGDANDGQSNSDQWNPGDKSTKDIPSGVKRIRAWTPLVTDAALLLASKLAIESLAKQVIALNEAIAEYDRELTRLMIQHPDAPLFETFPGAGEAMAPRLLAAFGADRERYAAASDLQQASGIAPVTARSGKSHVVRRRRACSKFLRQTFHEFAGHSLKASAWALAYYRLLRARGCRHHAAIRSLAFKWLRILFRCWQTRTPYDEARHLARLRQVNSPLLAQLFTD